MGRLLCSKPFVGMRNDWRLNVKSEAVTPMLNIMTFVFRVLVSDVLGRDFGHMVAGKWAGERSEATGGNSCLPGP